MQAKVKYLAYSGMDVILVASMVSDQGPKTPICEGSLVVIDECAPQKTEEAQDNSN